MKTQRRSPRSALRLSAMEATRWCRLGFQVEDDSQDQRGAEQISQIDDAADCAGSLDLTCMKCDKRVSVAKHLHNLSPFSLHSMIEVSAEAWHATLYLITPWQFPSLIAVHHARSSSIVTLLVLRSFICIWAQLCLVAGRAEASEVEDVRVRCAREVDVCMAHRCYRMRNGMRASPSPGVEPDPHEAAPPGVAM